METLKASVRNETGTRKARTLRKDGLVPAVIYGHGKDPVTVAVSAHDVAVSLQHGQRMLDLDVDGSSESVLVKDVQYDTFGMDILHVDFARVDLNEKVEVQVPIVLRGTPKGVDEGGMLQQPAATVTLEVMARSIPDELAFSVLEMAIGDSLYASDLPVPEGAKILDDPETLIANVVYVSEELEEEPAEEGAEPAQPEVIGEKTDEQEGEGEGQE